jgi:5-formyltetrahydrofolate cyclo-ligase
MDIVAEKTALRARMKAVRAGIPVGERQAAAAQMAERGLTGIPGIGPGAVVAGFLAINGEISPAPLLARLSRMGHPLALPVIVAKGQPLIFRAFSPGDALRSVQWGIREPTDDKPELLPDIVLTAGLAFDPAGHRLGFGGGYYDRTLRRLRAIKPVIAIGLAYDAQRIDAVPHLDYDERLDWVVTPSGPFRCGGTHR